MRIVLTPSAQRDMIAIRDYTRKTWGAAQARKYIGDIKQRIRQAGQYPLRYPLAPQRPDDVRRARSGSHIVLFAVHERHIEIVRILHERMDVGTQLSSIDD